MGYQEHKKKSGSQKVEAAVITVSDSRTRANDSSGDLIQDRLETHGHVVSVRQIVKDEADQIEAALKHATGSCDVVILTGGTGISNRDSTFEVVSAKLEKTLPGFGELFRMLSFEEIGAGAMLSRATAGVYNNSVVFSLPGSSKAVELAMDRLIVDELSHLVWEILRR